MGRVKATDNGVRWKKLAKSSMVTALADKSSGVANHKRLAVYTQITSDDMKPSTHFVTNAECQDATL